MLYSLAADVLLVVHFLFIGFVVLGGLLLLKWRRLIFLHLPAATWGALIEFRGWRCPLTPWEIQFRRAAGEAGYDTGFLEHYLMPLIYPANLNYDMQIVLGSFVIIINLLIYGWLGLRGRQDKGVKKAR
ncbi:DUF2784 domain-containing protein [Sulfuriflexus mobilis]|uniref:DUF2784 domain-containing protein n=1 Tax=Sulfuriflexus mobilis TaxID=1811807 RepID=UPI000F83426C|nr:DUF2784 domain-containing protein [Sulfuriflexus mobilis]